MSAGNKFFYNLLLRCVYNKQLLSQQLSMAKTWRDVLTNVTSHSITYSNGYPLNVQNERLASGWSQPCEQPKKNFERVLLAVQSAKEIYGTDDGSRLKKYWERMRVWRNFEVCNWFFDWCNAQRTDACLFWQISWWFVMVLVTGYGQKRWVVTSPRSEAKKQASGISDWLGPSICRTPSGWGYPCRALCLVQVSTRSSFKLFILHY